jgi:hypothetical protein
MFDTANIPLSNMLARGYQIDTVLVCVLILKMRARMYVLG